MPEINWGILPGGGSQNALATGLQLGGQFRQNEQQNALMEQRKAEFVQRQEKEKLDRDQQQLAQRRADLPLIGRLLNHARDETTYQQARAAAQQYGIDTSQLPPNFDPSWVEQQRTVIQALQDPKKAEALSSAGKAAVDMGYKPGTPEFNKAVNDIWTAGESKPYVVGGETRLYSPKIGGQGEAVGSPRIVSQRPAGMTDEQLFEQAHAAVREGANVEEVFRQLQAWGVNP